ncbi:hypothetical protein CW304_23965 [Bacillus sp. UFRGS-B20]|nr:hypothetical protein CW304_23965 [Bacillus sp. UFRGS-B20]
MLTGSRHFTYYLSDVRYFRFTNEVNVLGMLISIRNWELQFYLTGFIFLLGTLILEGIVIF